MGPPSRLGLLRWLAGAVVLATVGVWAFVLGLVPEDTIGFVADPARAWMLTAGAVALAASALGVAFVIGARRMERTGRALAAAATDLEAQIAEERRALAEARGRIRGEAAVKDDLIAAVSHELRTPLSAVIGFASIVAAQEAALDPSVRDLVDLIVQEGTEMSYIVDDLMVATHVATGSLTLSTGDVDLRREAEAVVARWNPTDAGRIDVVGGEAHAVGDAGRVRQILRNLVSNALRHGGPHILVSVEARSDHSALVVSDDGGPIPRSTSDHMFDMYFRVGSSGMAPSLGIGLAISRRLAETMGGALVFDRIDDRNVFELRLRPGGASVVTDTGVRDAAA